MDTARDAVLVLFRVVVGLLFAFHGTASLFGIFGKTTVPFGVWPSWWAAAIEFVGGILVLIGLVTRPAAIVCAGAMAYAYFVVHQPIALLPMENGGEPAALFSWAFLVIAAIGPVRWSIDTNIKAFAGWPKLASRGWTQDRR